MPNARYQLGQLGRLHGRQAYMDFLLSTLSSHSSQYSLWDTTIAAGQTVVPDRGNNAAPGTASGGVTFGVPGVAGRTAAGFGGAGRITTPLVAALELNSLTYGVWARATTPGGGYRIAIAKVFAHAIYAKSGIVGLYSYGGTPGEVNSSFSLTDGIWHLLLATEVSGQVGGSTLFVDGVSVKTGTTTVLNNTQAWAFGGDSFNENINGSLAFPFLCNAALDASTILEIYRQGARL